MPTSAPESLLFSLLPMILAILFIFLVWRYASKKIKYWVLFVTFLLPPISLYFAQFVVNDYAKSQGTREINLSIADVAIRALPFLLIAAFFLYKAVRGLGEPTLPSFKSDEKPRELDIEK